MKGFITNLQHYFLLGFNDTQADTHPLFKIYLMTHIINHIGKTSRYWEHSFVENIYNRWLVGNILSDIKKAV